jgi:circadian clock protein KaiC
MEQPSNIVQGTEADPARISTGSAGLDDILCGGLDAERMYLYEGRPGTGKTTLALQFLIEGVRQGERVLYVALSESEAELRLVAKRHGWTLDQVDIFELVPPETTLDPERELTVLHPAEIELSETTKLVFEKIAQINPARVVIDSLSELRLLAQNSLRYRRQVLALKHFFSKRHCTVVLLDDLTSRDTDLQLHSIAHGVILLEQLAIDYGAQRRRLNIVKMRGIEFRGGFHDFAIAKGGLNIFPRLVAAEHHTQFDADFAPAERGESVVYYAFDEGRGTLEARAKTIGLRLPAALNSGHLRLQQIDPAELSPGEFAANVRHSVEVDKARLVIIDSLNGYLNAMPDGRFLILQMHELLSYLGQQGVLTILVLAQHGLVGPMDTPVDISYLSDAVMMLRYFEFDGTVRRALSVVKKRSGNHERTIREFQLTPMGIQIGPPLTGFSGVFSGTPRYTGDSKPLLGAEKHGA